MSPSPEVVFLQPGFAHYREGLFNALATRLAVKILYVSGANEYPGAVAPGEFPHAFVPHRTGVALFDTFLALNTINPSQVITSVSNSPQTIAAWLWCQLRGKPLTLWIEEWIEPTPDNTSQMRSWARKVKRLIGDRVIKTAQHVVASGTAARNFAIRKGAPSRSTLLTIQCSEDLSRSWGLAEPSSQGHALRLLFMSRHIPSKGLDILLHAFNLVQKTFPETSLDVGGDGPCRHEWEKLSRELGLHNVRFHGAVAPNEVGQLFKEADVFILPSCVRDNTGEPWGLVINEATSMGLPVIVSQAVGAGYDLVVDGRNGYVVPADDPVALAAAINRSHSADLQHMGSESRRLFEEKNRQTHMVETFMKAVEQNRSL